MKISVIIATRNRKDDIIETVNAFKNQSYENKEIIVIDNASTDGTKEMMAELFPEVEYRWLPDNIDILAQNYGRVISDGDIIWRTDSDSYPETDDVFEKVVEIFKNNDDIDLIACEEVLPKLNNAVWEWYPFKIDRVNVPDKGYPVNTFAGPGAAIRRRVFDKVGGFWEFGMEEIDFSTKAILAGFTLRYFPNIRVLHFASKNDRVVPDRWVKISSQYIRYIVKYFPGWRAFFYFVVIYKFQLIHGIALRVGLSAWVECMGKMLAVALATKRNERRKISMDEYKKITMDISLIKNIWIFVKDKIKSKFHNKRK